MFRTCLTIGFLASMSASAALAQSENTIFFDDFEAYDVNTWPSPWQPDANAVTDPSRNRITLDPLDPNNQVLQLYGVVGTGRWAASGYHPVNLPDAFRTSFRIYNGSETIGSPGHNYKGTLGTKHGTHWSNRGTRFIQFHGDGTLRAYDGTVLQSYDTERWYDVAVDYLRLDDGIHLTYRVDGQHRGQMVAPESWWDIPGSPQDHFQISAQAGTVYYDDVHITSLIPEPAPRLDPPSPPEPQGQNLVLITHGLGSDASVWPLPMAIAIEDHLQSTLGSEADAWDVVAYDWRENADYPRHRVEQARNNAINHGRSLGGVHYADQEYEHIHLIGHSAGAWLIDAFADSYRESGGEADIHMTFLDAYVRPAHPNPIWMLLTSGSRLGKNASWAEHYHDPRSGDTVVGPPLANAYNIDVSDADDRGLDVPTDTAHAWPYEWYQATARPRAPAGRTEPPASCRTPRSPPSPTGGSVPARPWACHP